MERRKQNELLARMTLYMPKKFFSFRKDKPFLLTGSNNYTIYIYNILLEIINSRYIPNTVIFCFVQLKSNYLAFGTHDIIYISTLDTQTIIHKILYSYGFDHIYGMCELPNEQLAVSRGGYIKIWDLRDMRELFKMNVCTSGINCLLLHSSGSLIIGSKRLGVLDPGNIHFQYFVTESHRVYNEINDVVELKEGSILRLAQKYRKYDLSVKSLNITDVGRLLNIEEIEDDAQYGRGTCLTDISPRVIMGTTMGKIVIFFPLAEYIENIISISQYSNYIKSITNLGCGLLAVLSENNYLILVDYFASIVWEGPLVHSNYSDSLTSCIKFRNYGVAV